MRKSILFLTIILFVLILAPNVYADTANETINYDGIDYAKQKNIRVYIDKNMIDFDVYPQIIENRTMVPIRAIFEAFGMNVTWDQETKTVTASDSTNTLELTIDSQNVEYNGENMVLDVPAKIISGSTMVPLRFISENMGYHVVWIGKSNLILISKQNIVEWRVVGYETRAPYKECEYKFINGEQTTELRYTGRTNPNGGSTYIPPNSSTPNTTNQEVYPNIDLNPEFIKSKIWSDFEGFDYGNVYELLNGQIWRQTCFTYEYEYEFVPDVIIYKDGLVYKMVVENCKKEITVERIY